MKTINKYFRIIVILMTVLQIFSCTEDIVVKEDDNYTENTSIGGVWVRYPGPSGDRTDLAVGGIKDEPSNRVYMCEKKGSTAAGFYKGTLNGNTVVWDSEFGLPNTYLKRIGDELEFSYPSFSSSIPTMYGKGSWSGECGALQNNGGTGGTTGSGQAMFWLASDLGVGSITVSCNGVSRTINSYYSSGAPNCGAAGAANFTLNPGTYSYSASGGTLNWSGNITVASGGCSKLQLTK